MNDTVNPCEDFYSYVCGSWPVNYPVPEDKFKWDLDSMVEEKINIILKGIFMVINYKMFIFYFYL